MRTYQTIFLRHQNRDIPFDILYSYTNSGYEIFLSVETSPKYTSQGKFLDLILKRKETLKTLRELPKICDELDLTLFSEIATDEQWEILKPLEDIIY